MDEIFERTLAALDNPSAGFVARRDAAKVLGNAARRAWDALEAHRDDPDAYVRNAVEQALCAAQPPAAGVLPSTELPPPEYALEDLVQAAANGAPPEPRGKGFSLEVQLPEGRKQKVFCIPFNKKDGGDLIRVYTYCGDATPETRDWVLRSNAKLVRCAFALHKKNGGDQIILLDNLVAAETTPASMKKTVDDIARHGDWLEKKLTGLDEL